MNIIRFISRIVVGVIFIFSGFVKAIDPMGSTFKFTDYFMAFGLNFLEPLAFPLAIILAALEFVIGVFLVFNAFRKLSSIGASIFMVVFTPLTLILAINNPVTDCGCFGDALVLTNWETFFKNVIISLFVIVLFITRKSKKEAYPVWQQNLLFLFSTLFILGISKYGLNHLPIIDFRPYHIGANISEGMAIPPNAPTDEYKSILTYEKDGVKKEFDESNYPWQDSTWKFVETKQIKIKSGYTPPIHDFSISNNKQGDITDMVLANDDYSFLLISKNISKINQEDIKKLKEIAVYALVNNFKIIGLTATPLEEAQKFTTNNQLPFEFFNTDEIQLKTIVRSNPGLLLLKKGTILGKWNLHDFPDTKDIKSDLAAYVITQQQQSANKLVYISLMALFLLVISLFSLIIKRR